MMGGLEVFASAGAGGVALFLLTKLWQLVRRDSAQSVGITNDADRIESLSAALKEKEVELRTAYQTINAMVQEKATLHAQLQTVHHDLEEANRKIDKLTKLIEYLLKRTGGDDDPAIQMLLEAL